VKEGAKYLGSQAQSGASPLWSSGAPPPPHCPKTPASPHQPSRPVAFSPAACRDRPRSLCVFWAQASFRRLVPPGFGERGGDSIVAPSPPRGRAHRLFLMSTLVISNFFCPCSEIPLPPLSHGLCIGACPNPSPPVPAEAPGPGARLAVARGHPPAAGHHPFALPSPTCDCTSGSPPHAFGPQTAP